MTKQQAPSLHPFLVVPCLEWHFYPLSRPAYSEFLLINKIQFRLPSPGSLPGLSSLFSLCSSGNTLLWAFVSFAHVCHCPHCIAFWWSLCDNLPGLVVCDLRTETTACSPLYPACVSTKSLYRIITHLCLICGSIEVQCTYKKNNHIFKTFHLGFPVCSSFILLLLW